MQILLRKLLRGVDIVVVVGEERNVAHRTGSMFYRASDTKRTLTQASESECSAHCAGHCAAF